MPKAYWIAHIDVHDPETYKTYVKLGGPAYARYNAKFLTRGGKTDVKEGQGRARNVIIEFDSLQTAQDCYNSPEYTEARAFRQKASLGDLMIVEGVE